MFSTFLHFVEALAGLPLALTANIVSVIALIYSFLTRKKVDEMIKQLKATSGK